MRWLNWVVVGIAVMMCGCAPTGLGKSVALSAPTKAFPTPWPPDEEPAAVATREQREEVAVPDAADGPKATDALEPTGDLVVAAPQPRTYALIVAIESYRDLGAPATGAERDLVQLKTVLTTTFGIPAEQQRVAAGDRATKSDVLGHIDWLGRNVSEGGRVLFFFSGHGTARVSDGAPLLLPYDSDPSNLERSGLPLSDVLDALARTPGRDVLAFVDACYSGSGGRSVVPKGARPLLRIKAPPVKGDTALVSAAASDQLSGVDASGTMGLFTQHLVQAMGEGLADIDGDGQIRLSELLSWLEPRVQRDARKLGREQTPTLSTSLEPSDVVVAHGYPAR